jgi:hypothetical protein
MLKLEAKLPPELHDDGDLRIDGLIARRGKYFGKQVQVKGYVVDKVECPKEAKRCTIPHLTLADSPAGDGERMVVAQLPEEDGPDVLIGLEYVFVGQFARSSSDGFVRSKGLLLFEKVIVPEATKEKAKLKKKTKRRKRR